MRNTPPRTTNAEELQFGTSRLDIVAQEYKIY
jgi:hypothetical protein